MPGNRHSYRDPNSDGRSATVSIGVAAFPQHGTSPDALVKAADDALYRAKKEGKNRVVTAP